MRRLIPGNSGGPLDRSFRHGSSASARPRWLSRRRACRRRASASPFPPKRCATGRAIQEDRGEQAARRKRPSRRTPPTSNAERLFGLQLQDLTPDLTDALGLAAGKGVLVSAVEPDSPADSVGIERGLVIYRVGKYDVRSRRTGGEAARAGESRHRSRFHGRDHAQQRTVAAPRDGHADGALSVAKKFCNALPRSVVSRITSMIKVENLTKRYAGQTAIQDLNFEVGKGEIMGFLGPNGAGQEHDDADSLELHAAYFRPRHRSPVSTFSSNRSRRAPISVTCRKTCRSITTCA